VPRENQIISPSKNRIYTRLSKKKPRLFNEHRRSVSYLLRKAIKPDFFFKFGNVIAARAAVINMSLIKHGLTFMQETLFQGKLGVSIFLFQLAKRSGNPGQQKFTEKLLDEVLERFFVRPLTLVI